MSNFQIIGIYALIFGNQNKGYVSNYIDIGDGTFRCTVQRIDTDNKTITTEEILFGIKNIYGFISPNLPTQFLLMSNDNNIFLPFQGIDFSASGASKVGLDLIYVLLYITKKYGIMTSGSFLHLAGNVVNDSTLKSIPDDTPENKLKRGIYNSYLIASDIRNNGLPEDLKKGELYWKNTANISLTLYKLYDSKFPNFCVKINATNKINDTLIYFDCSSSSDASPDIIIIPEIEDVTSFVKNNQMNIGLGIGICCCILICCAGIFMMITMSSKKRR